MTDVTGALSTARERLCRVTDNRFDRRYRSLSYLQQVATMVATVGGILYVSESVGGGGFTSAVLVLLPLLLFPLLATLFAWWNARR